MSRMQIPGPLLLFCRTRGFAHLGTPQSREAPLLREVRVRDGVPARRRSGGTAVGFWDAPDVPMGSWNAPNPNTCPPQGEGGCDGLGNVGFTDSPVTIGASYSCIESGTNGVGKPSFGPKLCVVKATGLGMPPASPTGQKDQQSVTKTGKTGVLGALGPIGPRYVAVLRCADTGESSKEFRAATTLVHTRLHPSQK